MKSFYRAPSSAHFFFMYTYMVMHISLSLKKNGSQSRRARAGNLRSFHESRSGSSIQHVLLCSYDTPPHRCRTTEDWSAMFFLLSPWSGMKDTAWQEDLNALDCGVSQGAILSLLLYNTYMCPLTQLAWRFRMAAINILMTCSSICC